MTPEHRIMNEIRLWCGEHNLVCFRANVGKVLTADNRWFDTGLPEGFSDLIILTNDGKIIFCEVKAPSGRLRQDQIDFKNIVEKRGFTYVVAYSVDDVAAIFQRV